MKVLTQRMILAKSNPALEKRLNSAIFPGSQGGPLMHVIAGKAVAFLEAMSPDFKEYQQQVIANAQAMAGVFSDSGFKVVSGGTDNHMFLIDLTDQNITGKDAEVALGEAKITLNKNAVPGDQRSPFITSGLRIGTPAITTRGFKEPEAKRVAHWICEILADIDNEQFRLDLHERVADLCTEFPVYD